MTDLPNKPWFRIGEAATLLGVHANTVRNWIERGFLDVSTSPTGERRVTVQSLKRLLPKVPKDGLDDSPPFP